MFARLIPLIVVLGLEPGCSHSDCVFKSGRTCEHGTTCECDDGCNQCSCNDGELQHSAMACKPGEVGSATCLHASSACGKTDEAVCGAYYPDKLGHWYCPGGDASVCPATGCAFYGRYHT